MATFSPLTDVIIDITKTTNHYRSRGGQKIDTITIHHMAGNLSAETCGKVFQKRNASTNYGIDTDGRIGGYVPEEYGGWSTANPANDKRAINIELANDEIGGNWHVSDTAINRCIELVVDICKRNGITKLNYTGDKTGNLTRHNMFAATACPGPYLQSKLSYIAEEINKRLSVEPTPTTYTVKEGDTLTSIASKYNTTVDELVSLNELIKPGQVLKLPVEETIQLGDWVVPTRLVNYNGVPVKQYDDKYKVTALVGDKATCSALRNGQYVIWASMNVKDLKKVE